MMQIICILTYHCSNFPCFSTKGISTPASPSPSCDDQPLHDHVLTYGGGRQHEFSVLAVEPYITAGLNYCHDSAFKFVDHVDSSGQVAYPIAQNYIHTNIPLCDIVPHLSVRVALKIARLHHLQIGSHVLKSDICCILEAHNCISCNVYVTVFAVVDSKATRRRTHKAGKRSGDREELHSGAKLPCSNTTPFPSAPSEKNLHSGATHQDAAFSKLPDTTPFPPAPVDNELTQKIINDFCIDSLPSVMEEAGCDVCGQLVPVSQLTRLKGVKNMLHVLYATAVTRFERSDATQSIREYKGPVLNHACNQICDDC